MMNKIFQEKIGETLEVYMDDIIVKSDQEDLNAQHIQRLFKRLR